MKRLQWLALAVSVAFLASAPLPASAVPARPGAQEIAQPDGSTFSAVTRGDEWNNWVETPAGYAVAPGPDGYWYYVNGFNGKVPVLGTERADGAPGAGAAQGLTPAVSFPEGASTLKALSAGPGAVPPYGNFSGKVLFILARFGNRAGQYSAPTFASLLRNNIKDYFYKASNKKVLLNPATESFGTANDGVVGWVNVGTTHPNTSGTIDTRNQTITKNAIIAANPYVNFAAYDTNGDGYVDSRELAVVVIVAGYERSYAGTYSPSVWGHKWSLDSIGAPIVDGKRVGAYHSGGGGYAQFGEIHQYNSSDKHSATMGIMVHEIGHLIFGFPDLYDYDSSSSGIGTFCVMSYGSWGKSNAAPFYGQTPVLPSAYIKYLRGWVSTGSYTTGTFALTATGSSTATALNTVRKRSTSTASQFFLVENRRPLGYDLGMQSDLGATFGGIAIWHVDTTIGNNDNDSRRMVDLEEADGTLMLTGQGSKTDLWYVGNRTLFNKSTNPNSKLYSGASSGAQIKTLSVPGTVMNVQFTILP